MRACVRACVRARAARRRAAPGVFYVVASVPHDMYKRIIYVLARSPYYLYVRHYLLS